MKTLVRLGVTAAALGAAVAAMLATVGCNDPISNALSSALKPVTSKYTVGGMVSGLSGSGLVLEDNGGDALAVSGNGSFTFASPLASGSPYTVSVKTQPTNPAQSCTLTNASGSMGSANVTNVTVSCTNKATAAVTSVGSALGNPTVRVIDAAGGSVTSDDGRLTVTVPAGAVAGATNFTIQPITNQAPGGLGNAYRLGPAGQTFTSPVDITVHYASADLAGTVTDALSLGYQDAQDRWAVYKSVTLDTSNQAITVSSEHFSDWALIAGASLEPAAARIGDGSNADSGFPHLPAGGFRGPAARVRGSVSVWRCCCGRGLGSQRRARRQRYSGDRARLRHGRFRCRYLHGSVGDSCDQPCRGER